MIKHETKPKIKRRLWEAISLFLIFLILYLTFKQTDKITKVLIEGGAFTPFLAIITLMLLGPTPIATDPIVILVGITYGPFWGMIIGTIGNTLAMFIEYYFGFKIAEIFEYENEKKKLPKFIQKFPAGSWVFLVFGRMIPGYGSKVISLIAGAERVEIKTYLWTSILSGIFGAALLSYGGAALLPFLK